MDGLKMNSSWDPENETFQEYKKRKSSRGGLTGIGQKNEGNTKSPKKKLESQSDWRKQIIQRDGKRCKLCKSDYWLEAHHIIYKSQGGERTNPLNGIMLCKKCHMSIHARTLKFKMTDLHPSQILYLAELNWVHFDSTGAPTKGQGYKGFR